MIKIDDKEFRNLEEQVQYLSNIIMAGGGFKVDAFYSDISDITEPQEKAIYGIGEPGDYTYYERLNGQFYNLGKFLGPQGNNGVDGNVGEPGHQGPIGRTGNPGPQGPQGIGWNNITEISTAQYNITTTEQEDDTILVETSADITSGLTVKENVTVKFEIPKPNKLEALDPVNVELMPDEGFNVTYEGGEAINLPLVGVDGVILEGNVEGNGIEVSVDPSVVSLKSDLPYTKYANGVSYHTGGVNDSHLALLQEGSGDSIAHSVELNNGLNTLISAHDYQNYLYFNRADGSDLFYQDGDDMYLYSPGYLGGDAFLSFTGMTELRPGLRISIYDDVYNNEMAYFDLNTGYGALYTKQPNADNTMEAIYIADIYAHLGCFNNDYTDYNLLEINGDGECTFNGNNIEKFRHNLILSYGTNKTTRTINYVTNRKQPITQYSHIRANELIQIFEVSSAHSNIYLELEYTNGVPSGWRGYDMYGEFETFDLNYFTIASDAVTLN